MADNLFASVREEGRSIRTLTLKVRYNDMGEDQASESLLEPTDLEMEVYGLIRALLRKAWKRRVSLRLVSLKLSNLYQGAYSTELPFLPAAQRREASVRRVAGIDALRSIHGHGLILRAHDLRLRHPPIDLLGTSVPSYSSGGIRVASPRGETLTYIPLRGHSHYSFLDPTLSPAALVALAKRNGLPAVALTDTGNLHGAVEFVSAAKDAGIKPIVGAEISVDGKPLLLYAESCAGYHNLCRLLSRHAALMADGADDGGVAAQQRRPFQLYELAGLTSSLIAVGIDPQLADSFPNSFYQLVGGRAASGDFPAVVTPAIHYAVEGDRQRYDILQSIRTLTLLREPNANKRMGGQFHFRTAAEMEPICKEHPDWMYHTLEIAERCNFDFPFGTPQFPAFVPPDGIPAKGLLYQLVLRG